jgi:YD repeat-containing protein
MTTITDAKGNVTIERYWYGLRVAVTRGSGTPQAATTRYSYDPVTLGIVATSQTTAGDPSDHLTSASYDSRGLRTSETDPLGRATSYTYDALGNLTSVTAPNAGNLGPARITTTHGYDAKGNLTTETRRLYTTATEFTNITTTYQRSDPARPDLVTAMVDATGARTSYSYDADGNLTQVVSPTSSKATFSYDSLGRVTRTVAPRGNVAAVDPDRFATTMEYDAASRVTRTTVANGTTPIVTTVTYDRNGNQTSVRNADGKTTAYTYDVAGQLTSIRRPDGSTLASAYWPDGTLARQVDGAGHTTSYTSDPLGRSASVTDPLGRVTTYSYDALGNVATKKDPANQTTRFAHDPAGQLRSVTYSDNTIPRATYTRNPACLASMLVDGTGTSTWTYDSLGRMLTQTDGAGAKVSYGYDLRGAVTSVGYPSLGIISRAYDASGQLRSVTDWGGRRVTFDYDPDGNLTRIGRPNGVASTYTYDDPGRIRTIAHASSTTTLARFTYARTAAGLLLSTATAGIAAPTESYSYNALEQLTRAGAASYSYDKADNLAMNAAGAAQVFDAANELCWVGTTSSTTRSCATPVAGVTTYRSGARGNRIERKVPGASPVTTSYGYDQENLLKTISSRPRLPDTPITARDSERKRPSG